MPSLSRGCPPRSASQLQSLKCCSIVKHRLPQHILLEGVVAAVAAAVPYVVVVVDDDDDDDDDAVVAVAAAEFVRLFSLLYKCVFFKGLCSSPNRVCLVDCLLLVCCCCCFCFLIVCYCCCFCLFDCLLFVFQSLITKT